MNGERIETLVAKVRGLEDAEARNAALELVQAVMDLHHDGLDRVMELAASCDGLAGKLADDPAVGSLLLLHDLHPLDLEARVRRALESLRGRGTSADLLPIVDGVVRVHVEGGPAFEAALRKALAEAAPDASEIVLEGTQVPGFVPLEQLMAGHRP